MAAAERQTRRRAGRWTLLARTIASFARADRRVILARPGTEVETLKRKLFAAGRDAAKGAPPGRCQLSVPHGTRLALRRARSPSMPLGGTGIRARNGTMNTATQSKVVSRLQRIARQAEGMGSAARQ
jgi:hypothetical protein